MKYNFYFTNNSFKVLMVPMEQRVEKKLKIHTCVLILTE